MILLTHIIIACASLGFTGYAFISPSKSKIRVSYALVALTLGTGFFLLWDKPAHMAQACVSGLVYLGIVSAGIAAARHKLARVKIAE